LGVCAKLPSGYHRDLQLQVAVVAGGHPVPRGLPARGRETEALGWRRAPRRPRGAACKRPRRSARSRPLEEDAMTKVLGISGSLRRGSYNSALLRAAARLMPEDSTLDIASLRGIPLYDGDVEAQGIPASVSQPKEAIIAADGVLLVTPEYNNSIPGVFKNAVGGDDRLL